MAEEEKQEAEATAELAKPEDASLYIEERREQEDADRPPEDDSASEIAKLTEEIREKHGLDDKKKASRHERRKKAHELLKREAEELRAKLGTQQPLNEEPSQAQPESSVAANIDQGALENSLRLSHDAHGDRFEQAYTAFLEYIQQTSDAATYQRVVADPDPGKALVEWYEQGGHIQGAVEQGRNEEEFSRQLAERDRQIAQQVRLQMQVQEAAKQFPDFHETIEGVKDWGVNPGPVFTDLLMQHPQGTQMAYALAKDLLEGDGILWQLQEITDPVQQAKAFGRFEAAFERLNSAPAPARVTQAPPPMRPVKGGSTPPRDIHALAKSENADDYIAARRRQM